MAAGEVLCCSDWPELLAVEAMQGTVQAGRRETAEPATTGLKGRQRSLLGKGSQKSEQYDLLGLTTKLIQKPLMVPKL